MFKNTRHRMRTSVERGLRRALRMIRIESPPPPIEEPPAVVITEPFKYHNLIKLLMPSSPDITLLSEETVIDRDPAVHPHKYFLRVQLAETVRGQRTVKTLEVVAKVLGIIPPDNLQSTMIRQKMEKEMRAYLNVVEDYDEYQMTFIYYDQNYSDLFPVCYGYALSLENEDAEIADHSAAILLQNLHPLGFEKFREPCNYEVAKLIIKRLAQLHATPIAMCMHLGPRLLTRQNPNHTSRQFRTPPIDVEAEMDKINMGLSEELRISDHAYVIHAHLQRYAEDFGEDRSHQLRPWTTFVHSKCSLPNIMYKPEDNNGPANVKFLDPGYMKLGSCTTDLAFFLFTSVDTNVLQNHFDQLLNLYLREFRSYMSLAYIDLPEHTFMNFQLEFSRRCGRLLVPILMEISHLHYDNIDGTQNVLGASYGAKITHVVTIMRDHYLLHDVRR